MRSLLLLIALASTTGCGSAPQVPDIDPQAVVSVELRILPWESAPDKLPGPFTSADPQAVRAVIDAVKARQETSEHKCADRGLLVLALQSGKHLELRILPGHSADHYEYRHAGKIYRVNRDRFTAAVKGLGAEGLPVQP